MFENVFRKPRIPDDERSGSDQQTHEHPDFAKMGRGIPKAFNQPRANPQGDGRLRKAFPTVDEIPVRRPGSSRKEIIQHRHTEKK